MKRTQTAWRASTIRRIGWLGVASMLALAMLAPSAAPAVAGDKPEIIICHGTASHTNPYVMNSPSINSSGFDDPVLSNGHNAHVGPVWFPGIEVVWGDIIPPYDYQLTDHVFHYPGLNWTAAGQAIWNSGCNVVTTTTTTSTTTTGTTTTGTTTTGTTTTGTTTTGTTTQATATQATMTTFTASVLAETGVPSVTTPPTDSFGSPAQPSGESWRLLLIAMAGLLAAALVLTPATVKTRH